MRRLLLVFFTSCVAAVVLITVVVVGHHRAARMKEQSSGPPPGYYDIPQGFDFPADKQTLGEYRAAGNLSAERLHVWKVFAGMTQVPTGSQLPIFETWYSEDEAFQTGPTLQEHHPRRIIRHFRIPDQFHALSRLQGQAAGTALLSFVLYNYPAYEHIRSQRLYMVSQLESLLQSGAADPKVPGNRDVPSFPTTAVSLKTIWWPVARDKPTPMPIWDPESNPPLLAGNNYATWKRVVVIDPHRATVPPNTYSDATFLGKDYPHSHVTGLGAFYHVVLDQATVATAMQDPGIARAAQTALGRALQTGDYVVFAGTHLTTKEIDDWVWATFWWHDQPDNGPYAADRPDVVTGVWRNYLMSESFDLNIPREQDNSPHVAFNPWLEARFADGGHGGGVVSNCMNCHNRASYPFTSFLPIYRGDPDLHNDPAFASGRLRTDFLWSIPDEAQ